MFGLKKVLIDIKRGIDILCGQGDSTIQMLKTINENIFVLNDRVEAKTELNMDTATYYVEKLQEAKEAMDEINEIMKLEPNSERVARISELMKIVEDVRKMRDSDEYKLYLKQAKKKSDEMKSELREIFGDAVDGLFEMDSDETAEFKKEMEKKAKEVFGDNVEVLEIKAGSPEEAFERFKEILNNIVGDDFKEDEDV